MSERTRMKAYEKEAFCAFWGSLELMHGFESQFEAVMRRIPTGWRDFKLITSKMDKIIDALFDTIPVEQLRTIQNQARMTEIKVRTKRVEGTLEDDIVISRDDAAFLINAAIEGACMMCEDKNGSSCRMHQILQETPLHINNTTAMAAYIACADTLVEDIEK